MSEPQWKSKISDKLLDELGFVKAKPEDQKSPDFEEIATVTIPSSYVYGRLRYYKSDPNLIYFVISDEMDWLKIPVEPTEEVLRKLHSYYIEPALKLAKPREGQNMLIQVNYLRQATGREELEGDKKTLKWLFGYFDYEEGMAGVENALTMSGFVDPAGIRQATANKGMCSQFSTGLSGSLVTITRYKAGQNGYFVCEIQYHPSFHQEHTEKVLKEHKKYSPDLPSDVPLDVIGLFESLQFTKLVTSDEILKTIKDGESRNVMSLAVLIDDDQFESVFLPLASHEKEEVRNEVAYEALFRKNKKVYEAANEKGISEEIREEAKTVWPE